MNCAQVETIMRRLELKRQMASGDIASVNELLEAAARADGRAAEHHRVATPSLKAPGWRNIFWKYCFYNVVYRSGGAEMGPGLKTPPAPKNSFGAP